MSTRAHKSPRHRLRQHAFSIAILLVGSGLLQSCSGRPPTTHASSGAQPTQHAWPEAADSSPPADGCATHLPAPLPSIDGEVVVVEVATDVSPAGRRIWLGEAKNDIWLVTITGETVVRYADGQAASLEDVPAGACIQAGGRAGRATELIAHWIVILDTRDAVTDRGAGRDSAGSPPASAGDARDQ